jgi:hypothetical protein
MVQSQTTNFRYLAAQSFHGSVALALVTLAFFRFGIDLASTAFAYLIVVVLFSLMGNFIASALLAIMSVAGLNYVCCRLELLLCSANLRFPDRQSATYRDRFLAYLVDRDALDPKFARSREAMERILREGRPAVQRLLHHEIQWHGHGALDLPFDHGSSRGMAVSFRQ